MGKERDLSSQLGTNRATERVLSLKPVSGVRKLPCDKGARYRRQNGGADFDSKSFSDIDDKEISGYLNKKEEVLYKKTIWELMNKIISKREQQQSQKTKVKNAASKKAGNVASDKEYKSQRLSSKINYDVLRRQMEEDDEETSLETKDKDMLSDLKDQGNAQQNDQNLIGDESHSENGDYEDKMKDEYNEDTDVVTNYTGDYDIDNQEDGYEDNEDTDAVTNYTGDYDIDNQEGYTCDGNYDDEIY